MSCPDCFRGAVHDHAEPTGKLETIHGISTYVAGGSDAGRSKSTIIYLPDAFSLKLVNNKLLADKYAAATGCRVLVPDVVRNGGMEPAVLDKVEYVMGTTEGLPGKVAAFFGKLFTVVTLLPHAVPFMLFGHPQSQYAAILAYARAVRADLGPAGGGGGKLGAAGFCWGAWPSTKLCTEPAVEGGSERLIDAQFNGHPSYMVKEQDMFVDAIRQFKVPYAVAVAEKDIQLDAEVAAQVEAKVRDAVGPSGGDAGYVYDFHLYKDAKHGFCVKAQHDQMDSYYGAVKQATEWFNKYLN